jgi:hypothetical protein
MPSSLKHDVLLALFDRISDMSRNPSSSPLASSQGCCANCQYRFDPLLNRTEAWAYTGFKPGTLAVWDSTGMYDLQPIKFSNAVRYRLSSLNKFADSRTKP